MATPRGFRDGADHLLGRSMNSDTVLFLCAILIPPFVFLVVAIIGIVFLKWDKYTL